MLRHTIATVRTNFGDTKPFSIDTGVLQVITSLRPLCHPFLGLTIGPLLFADDILIAAFSRAARTTLVAACIRWLRKNGAAVNAKKSVLQSPDSAGLHGLRQQIEGLVFSENPHGLCLGVHTSNTGIYTIQHVRSRLRKFSLRLHALTRNGLAPGGIRPDVSTALFESLVISLVNYALGLCDPNSHLALRLDDAQDEFATALLGLPRSFPGFIARRELGLLDFSLRTIRATLLLLLRVHIQSDADPLTLKMLDWPIGPHPSSMTYQSQCEGLARSIGITMPMGDFLDLSYGEASCLLDDAIQNTQQQKWEQSLLSTICQDLRPSLIMPLWEIDVASTPYLPPAHRATFIMVRAGSVPHVCCGLHTHAFCRSCGSPSSIHHVLWSCPRTDNLRQSLLASMVTHHPQTSNSLASSGNHGPTLTHCLISLATASSRSPHHPDRPSVLHIVAAFLHEAIWPII